MSEKKTTTAGNSVVVQPNGGIPIVLDRSTRGVAELLFQGLDQLALAGKTMNPKDFMTATVKGITAYCGLVRTALAVDRHQKSTGDAKAGQIIDHDKPAAT